MKSIKELDIESLELAILHQYLFLESEINEKCKGSNGFSAKDCLEYYCSNNDFNPYGMKNRLANIIWERYEPYLISFKHIYKLDLNNPTEYRYCYEILEQVFCKHTYGKVIIRVLLNIICERPSKSESRLGLLFNRITII